LHDYLLTELAGLAFIPHLTEFVHFHETSLFLLLQDELVPFVQIESDIRTTLGPVSKLIRLVDLWFEDLPPCFGMHHALIKELLLLPLDVVENLGLLGQSLKDLTFSASHMLEAVLGLGLSSLAASSFDYISIREVSQSRVRQEFLWRHSCNGWLVVSSQVAHTYIC